MAVQVVDRRQRQRVRGGHRLGGRQPHQQRARPGPGPRVTATSSTSASSALGLAQGVVDGLADELEVVAGGDLGHDAAVAVVDPLRGDDVGPDLGRRP